MVTINMHPSTVAVLRQDELLARLRDGEDIDKRLLLEVVAEVCRHSRLVNGDLLKLAGEVLAEALRTNRLPPKQRGRSKGSGQHVPEDVARVFYDRLDRSAERRPDILASLAESMGVDERHVERLIREGMPPGGEDKLVRDEYRRGENRKAEADGRTVPYPDLDPAQ